MYNIIFTSMPIVWFAIFDFQYEKSEFLTNSKLYVIGLKNRCYGTRVFWQWFSLGAFQAFILLYICLYSQEVTIQSDGLQSTLWPSGVLIYAGVVIVANFQLYLAFNNISPFGVTLVLLSVACFLGFLAIESMQAIGIESMIGVCKMVLSNPLSYFAIAFLLIFVYGFEVVSGMIGQHMIRNQEKLE
jgi:magnesium-transporting ATPase (P-type)